MANSLMAKPILDAALWAVLELRLPPDPPRRPAPPARSASLDGHPLCAPRRRPKKVRAGKTYDARHCCAYLRKHGIKSRIARKGIDSSERLGRHRWVVERTLAWLNRFRRLTIRYERRADIYEAFLRLGCILVCWNFIQSKGFC